MKPHLTAVPDAAGASNSLATRLATAPGLVRAGASHWDDSRTPIHPLSMESAHGDPVLLRDLGARGARFAREARDAVAAGAVPPRYLDEDPSGVGGIWRVRDTAVAGNF